jgi:hypothetical protein
MLIKDKTGSDQFSKKLFDKDTNEIIYDAEDDFKELNNEIDRVLKEDDDMIEDETKQNISFFNSEINSVNEDFKFKIWNNITNGNYEEEQSNNNTNINYIDDISKLNFSSKKVIKFIDFL